MSPRLAPADLSRIVAAAEAYALLWDRANGGKWNGDLHLLGVSVLRARRVLERRGEEGMD